MLSHKLTLIEYYFLPFLLFLSSKRNPGQDHEADVNQHPCLDLEPVVDNPSLNLQIEWVGHP